MVCDLTQSSDMTLSPVAANRPWYLHPLLFTHSLEFFFGYDW